MPNSADIHLKPEVLARYGLPDIAYPVASADLNAAMAGVSELPLAAMLHGLQEAARDGKADWKHLEPAMNRLSELLAPEDGRDVISAAGDDWWLEIGPVDLGGKLVTVQRGTDLIAAITPRSDGRLRVAVYRIEGRFSAETYPTMEEAKLALFDEFWQLTQEDENLWGGE